jgi:4'-phosphopantetheinyl transferase
MPRPGGDAVRVWLCATRDGAPAGFLSAVLAREAGVAETEIRVSRICRWCGHERHGKPRLSAPAGELAFNLSRTKGLSLLAVADNEVGVDIERRGGPEVLEGSELVLAPEEREAVAAAPDAAAAFLGLWTRKEAYLKGIGLGLIADATRVTFAPALGPWSRVLDGGEDTGWHVRAAEVPTPWVAALAVQGPPRAVEAKTWSPAPG